MYIYTKAPRGKKITFPEPSARLIDQDVSGEAGMLQVHSPLTVFVCACYL